MAGQPLPPALEEVIRRYVPPGFAGQLTSDVVIAPGGLGLDSIALVELMMACEGRFGIAFPDTLLEVPPFTAGALADHLAAHRSGTGDGA